MNAVPDLPEIRDRHAFNLARWKEICANPELLKVEGRIESDAYGHILMSPPPGFSHSTYQARILKLIQIAGGDTLPECPVSTTKGVRGVNVVWISHHRRDKALRDNVLLIAPEVCVEVLSPGNTRAEMDEKRALLFEAGAEEVWFCDEQGRMFFFMKSAPSEAVGTSTLCPDFPATIG
jgi:Uma2 family endonuclease